MIDDKARASVTPPRSDWFKSSYSSSTQSCVEVRFAGDVVHIRDSKYRRNPANDPTREPIITVPADEWHDFLASLTTTAPAPRRCTLTAVPVPDGGTHLRSDSGTTLSYTQAEWQAFLAGVHAREFHIPNTGVTTDHQIR